MIFLTPQDWQLDTIYGLKGSMKVIHSHFTVQIQNFINLTSYLHKFMVFSSYILTSPAPIDTWVVVQVMFLKLSYQYAHYRYELSHTPCTDFTHHVNQSTGICKHLKQNSRYLCIYLLHSCTGPTWTNESMHMPYKTKPYGSRESLQ